ncbi:type II toxin-antitoxin system RelE/ParE family toxin [Lactiplantibacillus carotarum]|uniref:type II toxin-antitoxin system RelE/ParE family toxin n=1 Tax=Lactiplantibacillus carotarum TaxID=2993456 RepID=UPI00298F11DA|nr:type II toxin-antitoxin system RelE/ParE family toxin [Lactiplantibacillus carotarum]
MYKIEFYEDIDGYSEVKEFLDHLDNSAQKNDQAILKKITHQLSMLEILGPKLNEPQAKFLKGYRYSLMELRPMPERFFYAAWKRDHFVLLSHYTKKQNKTDRREVDRAIRLLEDWISRKG